MYALSFTSFQFVLQMCFYRLRIFFFVDHSVHSFHFSPHCGWTPHLSYTLYFVATGLIVILPVFGLVILQLPGPLLFYTVSPKNVPSLFRSDFDIRQPILTIFVRTVVVGGSRRVLMISCRWGQCKSEFRSGTLTLLVG